MISGLSIGASSPGSLCRLLLLSFLIRRPGKNLSNLGFAAVRLGRGLGGLGFCILCLLRSCGLCSGFLGSLLIAGLVVCLLFLANRKLALVLDLFSA
jgi:hypothetical protein